MEDFDLDKGVDVEAGAFPLPFLLLGGVCKIVVGAVALVEIGPKGTLSGTKIAAHRSYSRQSKYDFARRYLDTSSASRRASSGSGLGVNTTGTTTLFNRSSSAIWESSSVRSEFGLCSVVEGNEASNSAALSMVVN